MEWNKPQLFDIVKIADPRGNLSVLQMPGAMPFEMARSYWITDVPGGDMRTGHAYRQSQEVIIALSGSFEICTKGIHGELVYKLSRADRGLYVPAMTWREIYNFATNSAALIVSSSLYDESDYIRDLEYFNEIIKQSAQ